MALNQILNKSEENIRSWSNLTVASIASSSGINATQLQGRTVSSDTPGDNNVLAWSSGNNRWQPTVSSGINATQLQSRDIAPTAPANTNVLAWSSGNNRWEPSSASGGGGFVPRTSGNKDFYISNTGNDSNSGETPGAPVQTWNKLMEVMAAFNYDTMSIRLGAGETVDYAVINSSIPYLETGDTKYVWDFSQLAGKCGSVIVYGDSTNKETLLITGDDSWEPISGSTKITFNSFEFASISIPTTNLYLFETDTGDDLDRGYYTDPAQNTATEVYAYGKPELGDDDQFELYDMGTSTEFESAGGLITLTSPVPVSFKRLNILDNIEECLGPSFIFNGCQISNIQSLSNNKFFWGCNAVSQVYNGSFESCKIFSVGNASVSGYGRLIAKNCYFEAATIRFDKYNTAVLEGCPIIGVIDLSGGALVNIEDCEFGGCSIGESSKLSSVSSNIYQGAINVSNNSVASFTGGDSFNLTGSIRIVGGSSVDIADTDITFNLTGIGIELNEGGNLITNSCSIVDNVSTTASLFALIRDGSNWTFGSGCSWTTNTNRTSFIIEVDDVSTFQKFSGTINVSCPSSVAGAAFFRCSNNSKVVVRGGATNIGHAGQVLLLLSGSTYVGQTLSNTSTGIDIRKGSVNVNPFAYDSDYASLNNANTQMTLVLG